MSDRDERCEECHGILPNPDAFEPCTCLADENDRLRSQLDAVTRERDTLQSLFDIMTSDANKHSADAKSWRHRAERMEHAIRTVRDAYNEQRSDREKDAALVALMQTLDATPTRETP